ncbi:MAG: STAS domain-containing protein [Pirellulaceae bacterium]|nr:STAS domain-containing protein [Pirellulaceae bacterium]
MSKMLAEPYNKNLVISFLSQSIQNETDVKQASEFLEHYLVNSTEPTIIIDLARVRIMTSVMIGALVAFKKKCDKEKRKLKICGLTPEIKEVFEMTRLDKIFKVYPNREKALGRNARLNSGGVKRRTSLRE